MMACCLTFKTVYGPQDQLQLLVRVFATSPQKAKAPAAFSHVL